MLHLRKNIIFLISLISLCFNQEFGKNTVQYDNRFMDSFDHILTTLVNQSEKDLEFGVPFDLGPVRDRCNEKDIKLGNNWYKK